MNSATPRLFILTSIIWRSLAYISHTNVSEIQSYNQKQQLSSKVPKKPPTPPFPDGPCNGRIVTIPGEELYKEENNSFLNSNVLNLFSSWEDVVLPRRNVNVWLPREYDLQQYLEQRFPILYCHDGQNVMSDSTSWTGRSWRLIGAISRLHEHSLLRIETPPIVVLIPSGEGNFPPGLNQRHLEYGDFVVPTSQAHGHFVARALHPYLMQRFRVKKGPEHTYTIGSSLGGQASLQLVLRYPEIFGGAACMSPCFQTGTIAAVVANLVKKYDKVDDCQSLRSKRIYLDNGGDVDETRVPIFDILDQFTMNHPGFFWLDTQLQPTIDAMRWTLEKGNVNFAYKKYPGARHNERAWSNRIHEPLMHLYGNMKQYID
ncbi:hypothetical protein ACHAW6_001966 [Cyclotella cf. meneghiniana]